MADNEAQFRRVIEAAPDGIVVSRDGVVLFANPAAVRLLGYEGASELVGHPMSLFLDPEELALMRERVTMAARRGLPLAPQEYAARRRDGSRVTAEITSLPIEWDDGPAIIALVRDVTERVRLRLELARADRLRAVGTLAAGVAHEINNPLAYMALAVESLDALLRSRMADEHLPPALATVAEIRAGAQRVAAIVRDLRTFAQDGVQEDQSDASADVLEVLATLRRLVAHDVRHRATLVVDASPLPPVAISTRRLEQVMVNLVLNAAHAVEHHTTSPRILVRACTADERSVTIEVIDNGPGIATAVLPRIFDPFFTTKSPSVGSGLGLAISHRIVTDAGGSISVESEIGGGTAFRVNLPVAPMKLSPALAAAPAPTSSTGAERWRVLVIDDEPAIGRLLSTVLGHHDVAVVSSGEAALARLRTGDTFDVVVCDLMMPVVTGIDVFTAMAAERPGFEQRFVFVTGGAFTERARSFLAEIPNLRIDKPFTTRDLEEAMRKTVEARAGNRAHTPGGP